ncbi:uncharacterized protein M6B38_322090 [Iris pallida]|uniref:E3 ubiquitin-protein ligase RMA n=1 Tax=Iris pallida TaxID=29817 RepID=A0AAX6HC71_IRIPA|nr:uncharacterized protein M6B38_322090 [Iris pallida]
MADDERRRRRRRRMDLDLYLGLPRSPRRPTLDLGSDLSLSSLPHLSNTTASSSTSASEEMMDMSSSNIPRALFTPRPSLPPPPSPPPLPPPPPLPASNIADDVDNPRHQEHHAYLPSPMIPVPGFAPISSPDDDNSDGPIEIEDPESSPPPPPLRAAATRSSYVPRSPYYFPPRTWSYIPLDSDETDDPISVRPITRSYRQRLLDVSPAYAPPPSPPYSPPSPSYVRPTPTSEWLGRDDESSSHWDRLESPEFRFRRLIESNHRLRVRRFRSSLPYPRAGLLSYARASSPEPEQLMMDIMNSQRSLERNGKHKAHAGNTASESSEEGKEEVNISAANFECNICLDMAEDPVVTSCGHLFCWPCLYQWLHVHSDHKECPVCKGEVTECNVTPIYGRGSSGASDGKKLAENGESGLKIPPRPSGNRLESLRQQFHPIPRRFTEGMVTSWRQSMNIRIHNRNRFEAHREPSVPGLTGEQIALLNRVRADYREVLDSVPGAEDPRIPRENDAVPQSSIAGSLTGGQAAFGNRMRAGFMGEDLHAGRGPEAEDTRMSRESTAVPVGNSTATHFRGGIGLRRRQSIYDLAAADGVVASVGADTGRAIGSSNQYGASTSSLDPWIDEQWYSVPSTSAADQASASSTAAMIHGDVGHPDGSVEPNSRGSV